MQTNPQQPSPGSLEGTGVSMQKQHRGCQTPGLGSSLLFPWVNGSMGHQAEWPLRMWRLQEVGQEGFLGLSGVKRNSLRAAKHNMELLTGLPSLLVLLYCMPPPPNPLGQESIVQLQLRDPVGTAGERLNLHKSDCLAQVRL